MASGLLIRANRAALTRTFGALIPLQPIAWTDDGLICQPRVAADDVTAMIAACPFPLERVSHAFPWPDSEAALVAGWYRRTDRHAPAPPGVRELVQVAGEGFGPSGHPSTALCLAALEVLPPAPAIDCGCGSGLLAQAWATRRGLPVLAVDVDPAAVAHTRASTAIAGCAHLVTVRRQALQELGAGDFAGRIVFANVHLAAHQTLLDGLAGRPPVAVVLSGLRPRDASPVIAGYRAMGLRRISSARRGRFDCHVLVGRA